jgi:hypothetical protein
MDFVVDAGFDPIYIEAATNAAALEDLHPSGTH